MELTKATLSVRERWLSSSAVLALFLASALLFSQATKLRAEVAMAPIKEPAPTLDAAALPKATSLIGAAVPGVITGSKGNLVWVAVAEAADFQAWRAAVLSADEAAGQDHGGMKVVRLCVSSTKECELTEAAAPSRDGQPKPATKVSAVAVLSI